MRQLIVVVTAKAVGRRIETADEHTHSSVVGGETLRGVSG
jgi:hypothetical protein